MNTEHIWAVRDARGLNYKEVAFLLIMISRGEQGMFAKWHVNAADMGMSKDVYYRTRDSLLEKGLILAERRYDGTTTYLLNEAALSLYANEDSLSENGDSLSENGHSQNPETKENKKKNMKDEQEGEQSTPVAGAPVVDTDVSSSLNLEVIDPAPVNGEVGNLPDSQIENDDERERSLMEDVRRRWKREGIPDWATNNRNEENV